MSDLGHVVARILAARLSQEREQVRAERDREWRALIEAHAAKFDNENWRGWGIPQALARLAQDGPRPAQEGER